MIWKIWKKGKLKCEMIWKIWRKGKSNNEKIWKIHPEQQQQQQQPYTPEQQQQQQAAAAAIGLKLHPKHITNKNKTKHIMKISYINIIYDKTPTSH